jgi:hypothetical protein
MDYSRPRTNRRPIEEVETVVAGMQIGRVLARYAFERWDLGNFFFMEPTFYKFRAIFGRQVGRDPGADLPSISEKTMPTLENSMLISEA